MDWKELKYWDTGEWQVVQEKLADLTKAKVVYCPTKKNLFKALELTPLDKVKVVLLGQDPYPDPLLATGLAFSVPSSVNVPPSLKTIFKEYESDLHYPYPDNGDLTKWCSEGVLLWNVVPSCEAGKSMSHDWTEWDYLTMEILDHVSQRDVVVAAFGSIPAGYLKFLKAGTETLVTSHPSPRGQMNAKNPFAGSRIFSTINDRLCKLGKTPINWRLT